MIRRTKESTVDGMMEEKEMLQKKSEEAVTIEELEALEIKLQEFNRRWVESGGEVGDGLTVQFEIKNLK